MAVDGSQGPLVERVLVVGPSAEWTLHGDSGSGGGAGARPAASEEDALADPPCFEPVVQDCWPALSPEAAAAAAAADGGQAQGQQGESFELPLMVARFCLPSGARCRLSSAAASCNGLRTTQWDVILSGKPAGPLLREELPSFFTFVLTARDAAVVYGASLTFWEPLSVDEEEALWSSVAAQRGEALRDCRRFGVVVQRAVCLLSRLPLYSAFRDFLCHLYRSLPESPVPVERLVAWLCAAVPAPAPGGPTVQFPLGSRAVRVALPPEAALPLLDCPLHLVLQVLPIPRLLLLLQCMLLEQQVLLLSSQQSLLNWVCEAACALLFPLKWNHIRIPLLPCWRRFEMMLQMPVPYLIGASAAWLTDKDRPAKTVLFNLDTGEVVLPEVLPALPRKATRKLVARLDDLLKGYDLRRPVKAPGADDCPFAVTEADTCTDGFIGTSSGGMSPTPGLLPAAHHSFPKAEVQLKVFRFFTSLLKGYSQHVKEDSEGDFAAEQWVRQQDREDRPFFAAFAATQLFVSSLVAQRADRSGRLRPEIAACDAALREKVSRRPLLSRNASERCITSALAAAAAGSAARGGAARTVVVPGVSREGLPNQRAWRYSRFPRRLAAELTGPYRSPASLRRAEADCAEERSAASWLAVVQQLGAHAAQERLQRVPARSAADRSSLSPSGQLRRPSTLPTEAASDTSVTLSACTHSMGAFNGFSPQDSPNAPAAPPGLRSPVVMPVATRPRRRSGEVGVLELSCAGSRFRQWAVRDMPDRKGRMLRTVPDGARMYFQRRENGWLKLAGEESAWALERLELEDGSSIGWRVPPDAREELGSPVSSSTTPPEVPRLHPVVPPAALHPVQRASSTGRGGSPSGPVHRELQSSPAGYGLGVSPATEPCAPASPPVVPPRVPSEAAQVDPPSDPSSIPGLTFTVASPREFHPPPDTDGCGHVVDEQWNIHFPGSTVSFRCDVSCPSCSTLLSEDTVINRMSSGPGDFRTQCPRCRHSFRPSFDVSVHHPTAEGTEPRQGHRETVTYLSPRLMHREINGMLRQHISADEGLIDRHPTLWWNLLRQLRGVRIPLQYLLPQVHMGRAAARLAEMLPAAAAAAPALSAAPPPPRVPDPHPDAAEGGDPRPPAPAAPHRLAAAGEQRPDSSPQSSELSPGNDVSSV
eukprot:TRINITY_DN28543_c1_g1_i1.p1 TRINITY_DN28543_c1_g1~~TRINITY_DN28543_c1_g1_i1.p1  ORF type:complete len:1158 (+),score=269.48 TRINITY_DN28543_c1_g1_i1:73-3546(+)